jgi:alkane 1-monooxygenase
MSEPGPSTHSWNLLALVPPAWRRVMDGRVLEHYGGDVTRANIHPPCRGRVLARHGPAG